MLYYLIVCRSLTYAQRTAAALERAGITAHILRSPKSIAGEGCSHSVKLSQRRHHLTEAAGGGPGQRLGHLPSGQPRPGGTPARYGGGGHRLCLPGGGCRPL